MLLRWRCCYVASIVVVYRRGLGGLGGCNNVMWSALHWELWKPWGCCFVEDVVTLQVSLLFTEGDWGGWGGCNNVMWSALHWELWKPWGCCFVEDVVTLQVSLLFTEGGWGGWGGVITSCGVRWIQSCGNLEDVASLTMLLRCKYRRCSRSKQLLQKALVDVKMKKVWCSFRPWFSSELWHFLVINKTTKNAWNRNSNG